MDRQTEIPRHVDDPPQVLLWSAEELAPVALGLIVGVLMGKALMFCVAGLLLVKVYRRFSDGHSDGYLLHALYWYGFIPSKAKTVPNPYSRRFLP